MWDSQNFQYHWTVNTVIMTSTHKTSRSSFDNSLLLLNEIIASLIKNILVGKMKIFGFNVSHNVIVALRVLGEWISCKWLIVVIWFAHLQFKWSSTSWWTIFKFIMHFKVRSLQPPTCLALSNWSPSTSWSWSDPLSSSSSSSSVSNTTWDQLVCTHYLNHWIQTYWSMINKFPPEAILALQCASCEVPLPFCSPLD